MCSHELHARLLEDARKYDPAAHHRSLLAPFKDVILVFRAKFMSYEQISATFSLHGLKVSPAAVGVFCRRTFSKAEIMRVRQGLPMTKAPSRALPSPATVAPALGASAAGAAASAPTRRGPKIARDNY